MNEEAKVSEQIEETTDERPSRLAGILTVLIVVILAVVAFGGNQVLSFIQSGTDAVGSSALGQGFPAASVGGVDNSNAQPVANGQAPDFLMTFADGSQKRLSDFHGRPIVINFWATWCGPCRMEMPELVDASHTHDDLVMLTVNLQESLEQVRPFAEEFQMNFLVPMDQNGEIATAYQVRNLPSTFFIDRDGFVRVRWTGLLTPDILQQNLEEIL